jgi:hypothetical protein
MYCFPMIDVKPESGTFVASEGFPGPGKYLNAVIAPLKNDVIGAEPVYPVGRYLCSIVPC